MEREKQILEEVEKTMNSFESLPKLESNPFLFTRIKARIQSEGIKRTKKASVEFIFRPATLAIILILNIATAVYFFGTSSKSSSASLEETLKSEYSSHQIQLENYYLE